MKLFTLIAIDFVKTNAHIFYRTESFLIPLNLITSIRNTYKKPFKGRFYPILY